MAHVIECMSDSEAETIDFGRRLAALLSPGDTIALAGELGAGKTRFVRGLASGLGHDPDAVNSPTFVLANEYDDAGARCPLVHLDAYRLDDEDDMSSLGWDRVTDGSAIVVVEWADRVSGAMADASVEIMLEHAGETVRAMTMTFRDKATADAWHAAAT